MVPPIPPRVTTLLAAVALVLMLPVAASASARDVINDLLDNGRIDSCHPRADYTAALRVSPQPDLGVYGISPAEAVSLALGDPALVGTASRPCPDTQAASSGGGSGAAVWVGVAAAVAAVGGGTFYWLRRRRAAPDED